MRRACLAVTLLAVGSLLLSAALARPVATRGGTLRIGQAGDLDAVDPALAYTAQSWMIEYATCAKLFNYPDATGTAGTRLIPEVAARTTVSPNGRTYTFDLKKTFRFHTGAPVTAQSFALALNRDANPAMGSPATNFMRDIVGVAAVLAHRSQTISGVRVLGRYRLQIMLTKPAADLPLRLSDPFFCPVLPSTPADPNGIDDAGGSGPYYVASHVPNRQIVLRRNRFYRGMRPANADQIVWTLDEPSRDACFAAVEQGALDDCPGFPPPLDQLRSLAQKYGINRANGRFFVTPVLATIFFAFNHDRPAFAGPGQIPLAKAINYAIDRPALARVYGYLGARRTDQLLPAFLGRDDSIYPIAGADPVTARKWLAKAKLKPTQLVLYVPSSTTGVQVGNIFAFDLKQIGIDVDVHYFSLGTLGTRAGTRGEAYDVAYVPWAVDYPDGSAFFEPLLNGENLTPTGNFNLSYLDDPQLNARIDAASRVEGDARRGAWGDLDVDMMKRAPPIAAFVNLTSRDFVSASFGCFVSSPVYGVDLSAACKK